ncbi:DUF2357 domain-containing protein [Williamsia deligens]|uniref:DUF2357 domain-containing protein n=1 Tax=Williamsia deligens TaxID=321325 RepID=A0ABW3GA22_9NOCA|nr:DUF2357 domain-containing protein [Williamsia deligens]MCP2192733.1 hypothetical protein [Williamsia deligens]
MIPAVVELIGDGDLSGRLTISSLPRASYLNPEVAAAGAVVLREGGVYRFKFDLSEQISKVEPSELFDFDDNSFAAGRLLPGESVGVVSVMVTTASGENYRGRFDVRSAKFSDEQAFGRMLADLAELSIEAMHQGFAPSSGLYGGAAGDSPRLLYQQFAVLQSLLAGSDLLWAISQILADPHRAWESVQEPRPPGRPLRGSSRLGGQLGRPGARVLTPRGPLSSMPRSLLIDRTEETVDTIANRFARFALERWRAIAVEVVRKADKLGGAAKRRGVEQAGDLVALLDEVLSVPLFREVEPLSVFPGDNQVLRRREGYRQLYAAWALVEGTVGLDVDLEDLLLVSRRSVASLYEYWTFTRLADAVAQACGGRDVAAELFAASGTGMSLVLRADAMTRLKFETVVAGQAVLIDLFFNKEFREASWTRPMRPDASLLIRAPGGQETWLHFDAKYRVDWASPFETGEVAEEEDSERRSGTSKRTDLLKMHAYRDAIRASAGSYVLFPGSRAAEFAFAEGEFLPGLGAFPLRPDESGQDTTRLAEFVNRSIQHVAASGTRYRRATYWSALAYAGEGTDNPLAQPPVGELPPADTGVLLGYVRSDAHWRWIRHTGLYNVRTGERRGAVARGEQALDGPLMLLYGAAAEDSQLALCARVGVWEGATRKSLERLGYPAPRGEAYLVARLQEVDAPAWLHQIDISRLLPEGWLRGRPYSTTWLDVVLSTQGYEGPDSPTQR